MAALANNTIWYCGSTKWTAVTAWAALGVTVAGAMVRQLAAPTINNERVFICIVAGTTGAAEPTWVITKGAKTTDGTVTWMECTGIAAVNGDITNTTDWNSAKTNTVALGQIIKRISAASYQICTTAGTAGSGAEPAFSDTAGVTTVDNTVTWTSLGVVGNFTGWQACHARIKNAGTATWMASGDTCYVSNNSAETGAAAATVLNTGAANLPMNFICVVDTAAPPVTLATTASCSTTGNNALTIGSNNGYSYVYGMNFFSGTGATGVGLVINPSSISTENCSFNLPTTAGVTTVSIGRAAGRYNFKNPTFTFGAVGQSVNLNEAFVEIVNGTFAATGTVPTTLFSSSGGFPCIATIRDSDLSNIPGTLCSLGGGSGSPIIIYNCKINAAVTPGGSSGQPGGSELRMHNCDSGTKNYRFFNVRYEGTMQQETTIIRTGGASDGTTHISWKVIAPVVISTTSPFVTEVISEWQENIGSPVTATVEIASAITLTNADIWLELEYLGSSATPIATSATTRVANLVTPTNVTASSATWVSSPGVTQKLQITFTPQMKGAILGRVYVGRKSTTVYIDPVITVA